MKKIKKEEYNLLYKIKSIDWKNPVKMLLWHSKGDDNEDRRTTKRFLERYNK